MTDKEILIQKGKTFSLVVRWETEPIVRKAITAVLCAFVMAGLLTLFMIDLVERDCRRDIRFDEDGRKSGWKRHPDNPLQDFHIYERGER